MQVMMHRLGELAEPYKSGRAGTYAKLAKALSVAGAGAVAVARPAARWRGARRARMVLAGAVFERWTIFKAGFQSAADPKYTVGPQRARIEATARKPGRCAADWVERTRRDQPERTTGERLPIVRVRDGRR